MKSEELGLLDIDNTLGELLPYLKGSNKDIITLKEALSHNGKIKPWIPYYLETIDSITKTPFSTYFSKTKTKEFSIKVAEDLYLINSYTDSIIEK
jgi:hypothetical protein